MILRLPRPLLLLPPSQPISQLLSCLPANPKPVLISSCFVCRLTCCVCVVAYHMLCVWCHAVLCSWLFLRLFCLYTVSSLKRINVDRMPRGHFLALNLSECDWSLGQRAHSQRQIRVLLPACWKGRTCRMRRMWIWTQPRAAVLLQCWGGGWYGIRADASAVSSLHMQIRCKSTSQQWRHFFYD